MPKETIHNNRPIAEAQKQLLIANYQQTQSVSAAMRAAGVSRRTAYRWLHRYEESGEVGLRRRPYGSKRSNKTPESIEREVVAVAVAHPDWGRRKIAAELASRQPPIVRSASTVSLIVKRNSVEQRSPQNADPPLNREPTVMRDGQLDSDLLEELVIQGLRASYLSASSTAATLLYHRVWQAMSHALFDWRTLLTRESHRRNWLLRSRVQAGHSLMNTGQWVEAADILEDTRQWMYEAERVAKQIRKTSGSQETPFSLRWDDIWIHCLQLLGIVLRRRNTRLAHTYFEMVITSIEEQGQARRVSSEAMGIRGNLQRDLSKLLFLRDGPTADVLRRLTNALAHTEDAGGDPGMMGATHKELANYHGALVAEARRRGEMAAVTRNLDDMQQSAEQALDFMRRSRSPILEVNAIAGAAMLYIAHDLPVDTRQLQQAAEYALQFGYGGQARQILKLPRVEALLPSDVLRQLDRAFGKTLTGHPLDGF